jgi:3-oxoacyl-[acyl-carrier protein] reductase
LFDLSGRTALVTGASGGIGGAIARALHRQGAAVVLSGTRREALEALGAELGARTHTVPCDLADEAQTAALIENAAKAAGQIDILVNNAGLTRDMLSMRLSDAMWQKVLDVNLTAAFRLTRDALKDMIRRRHGRIVNITSIVGVTGNPGQANYAASKAGLIGMTKSIAAEVAGRNITVNCVAPGFIKSAMTDSLNDQLRAKLLERIPAGRLGSGEDCAAAVVFLASAEAAYITGQTIHVNGGMAMI